MKSASRQVNNQAELSKLERS